MSSAITIPTHELEFILLRMANYISVWRDMFIAWEALLMSSTINMIKGKEFLARLATANAFISEHSFSFGDLLNFSSRDAIAMTPLASGCMRSTDDILIMSFRAKPSFVVGHAQYITGKMNTVNMGYI